jgi:hypothetical protein
MICTVCCATKRQVEIACPADCTYLTSAKAHPPAVVQRRQERDVAFVLPLISDLSDTQYRLLLFFQSLIVKHAEAAIPAVLDTDVAEAAATVAATLETAGKGIIYEHQAAAIPAQRLSTELGRGLAELAGQAGAQRARIERDAAVALRRIEKSARSAATALAGDEEPIYLRLLARMLQPGAGPTEDAAPAPASGLIVTP